MDTAELVVIGGGPGGYSAAFRASDLGKKTILVERYPTLGGVCLNVGCIPSKVLLHMAKVMGDAAAAKHFGIEFPSPHLDLERMRVWKQSVVAQLNRGLAQLAKQRDIPVIQGVATFLGPNRLQVQTSTEVKALEFEQAIIATGSKPAPIPGFPSDTRIVTSTGALALANIPQQMLIIGGGVVGLEMATAYQAFGSRITVVEAGSRLIPGADDDLLKPLVRFVEKKYEAIHLNTRVSQLIPESNGIRAVFDGDSTLPAHLYDQVLVSVGRQPNSSELSLDQAGVRTDKKGHIMVDHQLRTSTNGIYAVGDITGPPMLAHKAAYEGKIAAEVACGRKSAKNTTVIPMIAYTDPELAWVGITEQDAQQQDIAYGSAVFPWAANGRSLTMGRNEGKTKMIFAKESRRVIGAGIVGSNAGELIAHVGLAIEMGCDAEDLSLMIHPHPTLAESLTLAAELFEGTITDLFLPKRKRR